MKKFKFSPYSNTTFISLINLDNKPVVKSVSFGSTPKWWMQATLHNETSQQKEAFRQIPDCENSHGYEEVLGVSVNTITRFIDLVNKLDPLPPEFFQHIYNMGLHIPKFAKNVLDPVALAKKGEVDEAIKQALDGNKMGFPDMFVELANYYNPNKEVESKAEVNKVEADNNESNWKKVLESVPSNCPFYAEAQEALLGYANAYTQVSLAEKFKLAYNGNLMREAELYFSELAGEKNSKPLIKMVPGSNPDTLIELALVIQQKNDLINKISETNKNKESPKMEYKDEKETLSLSYRATLFSLSGEDKVENINDQDVKNLHEEKKGM